MYFEFEKVTNFLREKNVRFDVEKNTFLGEICFDILILENKFLPNHTVSIDINYDSDNDFLICYFYMTNRLSGKSKEYVDIDIDTLIDYLEFFITE